MDSQSPPFHGPPSFPVDPQVFDSDERISFSKPDQKFLLVADDGSEYEFDDALRRWIPILDDELAQQQQAAYKVQGVDEEETVEAMRRKRKKEYVNGEDVSPVSLSSQTSCSIPPAGQITDADKGRKTVARQRHPRKLKRHSLRGPIRPSMSPACREM